VSSVFDDGVFLAQHGTEKFIKKFLGENEIEAVLYRLDRLTQDEARATGAQTLEIVYGLVQHRRVIMDGENTVPLPRSLLKIHSSRPRRQGIGRWCPGGSRLALLLRIIYVI
jgi:hypothetical protein